MSSLYSTPLPHRGIRNRSCDAPLAAGIYWARVWQTRRFQTEPRNASFQSVSLQFPCRALLHQWGKEDPPNCPYCNERESLGHIQSRCKILEKPRISAHHMIWREILLQLFGLSGDEGDEHKWVIPSVVSADSHKEHTVRQIIQHFGFFASDAALEDKILAFFTQRATLALSHVGHLQDPTDPTSLALDAESHADFLTRPVDLCLSSRLARWQSSAVVAVGKTVSLVHCTIKCWKNAARGFGESGTQTAQRRDQTRAAIALRRRHPFVGARIPQS